MHESRKQFGPNIEEDLTILMIFPLFNLIFTTESLRIVKIHDL